MAAVEDDSSYRTTSEARRDGNHRRIDDALQNVHNGRSISNSSSSRNTRVVKSINVTLPAVAKMCATATDPDHDDGASYDEDTVRKVLVEKILKRAGQILRHVRESATLQSLCLKVPFTFDGYFDRECSVVAGVFLQAILDNHELTRGSCSIEKLEIQRWCYMEQSPLKFINILGTVASLRNLTIFLDDSSASCEWILQAFRSNTSLEYLCIDAEVELAIGSGIVAQIIDSLCRHPSLRTLALPYYTSCAAEQIDAAVALGNLLRHTPALRRLDMEWVAFLEEGIACFVDGLRSNCGSFQELDMGKCALFRVSDEACETFMDYMNSAKHERNRLHKLTYKNLGVERLAESVETPGTVGSTLRDLALCIGLDSPDCPAFLETLASRGCRNKLERLSLQVCNNGIRALSTCLRSFSHLQTLEMRVSGHAALWNKVVKAVKKNGSLHKVSWLIDDRHGGSIPDHQCQRHLDAVCSRNRLTPKLLANPRVDDQQENEIATSVTSTAVENFPSLFTSSMDAERTAPNTLLIGLLATTPVATVDFGHGQQKRLRPIWPTEYE